MVPIQYKNHIKQVVSKHYTSLVNTIRYERFMVNETPQEWMTLLGPDVCLLTHADTTAVITEKFIHFNELHNMHLDKEARYKLFLTPWIHDWGEIIIDGEGIGDISFENRSESHQKTELEIFTKVIKVIPDQKIRQLFLDTYSTVVVDTNTQLWEMFNAIERLGYLETAILAFKGKREKRITNWHGLVGNVLSNQTIKLLAYAPSYPFVAHYLDLEKENIHTMIQETIKLQKIPRDNTKKPSFDKDKLHQAGLAWKESTFV